MAKKNTAVAYVPISNQSDIKEEVEKIDNTEIANYKDPGVEYQKYSKVKIQGNKYKLLPQETWRLITSFGWTASNALLTLNFATPEQLSSNNFYITSMVIFTHTDVDCSFFIDDYATSTAYVRFTAEHENYNVANFDFSANPLKVDGQIFSIQPRTIIGADAAQVITGKVRINFFGFKEQKP